MALRIGRRFSSGCRSRPFDSQGGWLALPSGYFKNSMFAIRNDDPGAFATVGQLLRSAIGKLLIHDPVLPAVVGALAK